MKQSGKMNKTDHYGSSQSLAERNRGNDGGVKKADVNMDRNNTQSVKGGTFNGGK